MPWTKTRDLAFCSLLSACLGCGSESTAPAPSATVSEPLPSAAAATSVAEPKASASSSSAPSEPPPPPRRIACNTFSLEVGTAIDGSTEDALASCIPLRDPAAKTAHRCGRGDDEPALDLSRLDASVLAFDDATEARVREIAELGRTMNRDPRAVGLLGDSMTVSHHFLRPFASDGSMRYELAPEVQRSLSTVVDGTGDATIVDFYRGRAVVKQDGRPRDSFNAPRAAEIGVKASWALKGGDASPAGLMIEMINPAIALVLYGGNDAAYRVAPPEELAESFRGSFVQLLDALERNGIVPVLSTLARHAHQPGVEDCGDIVTNWRIAVATNAINREVAKIACERHLPLIDLRHAMDGLVHRGLSADGVHPTFHADGGAGILTARGLACGYNVRNYVTLRMLKQVKELLEAPEGPWVAGGR